MSSYAFAKRTQKALERLYRPMGASRSVFWSNLQSEETQKPYCSGTKPQNEPCAPGFPVHTRWVVCGTSINLDQKENYLEDFVIFLYFPNLGKTGELKLRKRSAFHVARPKFGRKDLSFVDSSLFLCVVV